MAVIEITGLKKSFGSKIVHKGVNISLHKGECLGLLGASGSGKSVILRSLIGLEKPDAGEIYVHGKNIMQLSDDELISVRKKVAYVFQNGALFDSMSVYDNLAYPLREHSKLNETEIRNKITSTLKDFGLSGNENVYPSDLSGGMQKRLGMARSIIMNPEIVLYDEPTAGLDPYNTRKLQEMMLRLKAMGTSSIFVTHDMPSALAVCDRIVMLVHGEIKANGLVEELKKQSHGIIQKFMNGEESA